MKASETRIGWVYEITEVIRELLGLDGQNNRMFRWLILDEYEEEIDKEDENGIRLGGWSLRGRGTTFI